MDAGRRMLKYDVFKGNFGLVPVATSTFHFMTSLPAVINLTSWGALGANTVSSQLGSSWSTPILSGADQVNTAANMELAKKAGAPIAPAPMGGIMAAWNLMRGVPVIAQFKQYLTFNPYITLISAVALLGLSPQSRGRLSTTVMIASLFCPIKIIPFMLGAMFMYEMFAKKAYIRNGLLTGAEKTATFVANKFFPQYAMIATPMIKQKLDAFRSNDTLGAPIKLSEQRLTLYARQLDGPLLAAVQQNRAALLRGEQKNITDLCRVTGLDKKQSYGEVIGHFREDENIRAYAPAQEIMAEDDERLATINPTDNTMARSLTGGTMLFTSTSASIYNAGDIADKTERESVNCQTTCETLILWLGQRSSDTHTSRLDRMQQLHASNPGSVLSYRGDLDTCRVLYRLVKQLYGDDALKVFKFTDLDKKNTFTAESLATFSDVPTHLQNTLNNFLSTDTARRIKEECDQAKPSADSGLKTLWRLIKRTATAAGSYRYEADPADSDFLRVAAAPAA